LSFPNPTPPCAWGDIAPVTKTIAMISDMIKGVAIPATLTVKGYDSETDCIVLNDGSQNWLLSKRHLDELESLGKVTYNSETKTLTANWRKAGERSKFLRGDLPQVTQKVTVEDIAKRLGI